MALAWGKVHVAGGRQGLCALELPGLSVSGHSPASEARDVDTDLAFIGVEFSRSLPEDLNFREHVRIQMMDARIGEEVTEHFTFAFAEGEGMESRRRLRILPREGTTLSVNTAYLVTLQKGMPAAVGGPLGRDYTFRFFTSRSADGAKPRIVHLSPDKGSIQGGTEITVSGYDFGRNPVLYLGGQRLVIQEVLEGSGAPDGLDRVRAITAPHYAGPASLRLVHENGREHMAIGIFTYVDMLQIGFVHPAVVRVAQTGERDRVTLTGYGFHDGLELRVYRPGDTLPLAKNTVDGDALSLYSA
jgi:hypothetical protein